MKHKIAQVKQMKRNGKNVTVVTREMTNDEKQADLEARVSELEAQMKQVLAQLKVKGGPV